MFVCLFELYLNNIYRSILITQVRARATTLTTNLHRPLRWLFFGLVGRQPLFTSACFLTNFLFLYLSISISVCLSPSLCLSFSLFLSVRPYLFLFFIFLSSQRDEDAGRSRNEPVSSLFRVKVRKVMILRAW